MVTDILAASFIISLVAPFLTIFADASKASEKLLQTIQQQARIQGTSQGQGIERSSMAGDICFENVSFNYPSRAGVPVLENVSLSIPGNKMTGVVGLSGSGKSTIAALVERFYDPNAGRVTVDGTDLRDFNVQNYHGHVSIVEQMPKLFNRSVLENIAHGLVNSGRPEHQELQEALCGGALAQLADDTRKGGDLDVLAQKDPALQTIVRLTREAADLVGATEYIVRLPHGLATPVGPGGNMLSGGQRQRAAFARAVIRNPSILILDEATAALDSASEAWIQHAMDKFSADRTTIVIAHRLSTIKNADNILVIGRGGKVVEQGTYDSLMGRDGVFASLVRLQSLKTASDEDDVDPRSSSETTSGSMKADQKRTRDGIESFVNAEKSNESEDGVARTNNHALENTETNTRGFLSTFGAILGFARPQSLFIVLGIMAATIVGGSHSGEAVIFGNVVGRLNSCRLPSEIRESASLFGGLFFGLALVEFLANVASAASFGWVSEKLLFKTRVLSLRSLLDRSLHWHDSEGRTPGTLVAYISADPVAMSGMTGTTLGITFSVLVSLVSGIVLAHVIAWKIALVLLACVPVLFMSGFLRLRVQARFAARHAKAFADSVAIAIEAVDSIRTVCAFSLQGDVANTFLRSLRGPYKSTLSSILYGNFLLALSFSIGNCVYALAYWWGAKQTANGMYTQTQFFIVLTSLLVAAQSSGQIVSLAPDISKAAVASRRVLSLIVPKGEKASRVEREARWIAGDPEKGHNGLARPHGSRVDDKTPRNGVTVALSNVNFAYPSHPDVPVLSDVSLDIPAGSFAALVGPSGAGKSTIVSLLERLYVPASGSITLDGLDITQAPEAAGPGGTAHASFRDETALVPQETVLFSGTVAFNIGLGARPGEVATQAEIESAARLACIHDTIAALPQGYETPCGPSAGLQLFSGGQKQRLCIARALVRRPRLLLLDESSSSLDAESEARWEAALETVRAGGGVTIVAIAHRLRTIMKAGVIFVIENGRVLDRGSHEELVARCERYRNDVLYQTLE